MRAGAPHLLAALAFLSVPAGAQARALEAESGRVKGSRAAVVKDRTAFGGRAVVLAGTGTLRRSVVTRRTISLTVRAKAGPCAGAPKLRIVVDGRRRASRIVRSRRFKGNRFALRTSAGRHTLGLRLTNPRRSRTCRRRLVIDRISLREAPVRAPAALARAPVAAPAQEPDPAPPLIPIGYRNPVALSTPDPMVLRVGGDKPEYFAFYTGSRYPIRRSTDLVRWEPVGTAMTNRPAWTHQTGDYHPWAPSVIERAGPCPGAQGTRCFVLFYVALDAKFPPGPEEVNCIGVATSPDPAGPYTDLGPLEDADESRDSKGNPIGCGDGGGYSNIDPAPFVDPRTGEAYLYLSTANACDTLTGCASVREIGVMPLSRDLLTATGPRKKLFSADRPWEEAPFGKIVENPWVVERGGTYFLLYSGGNYQRSYGMGYATASSPTGPFVKASENPFLRESEPALSVGGGMVVTGPKGGDWLAYHGRDHYDGPRTLRIDPVLFSPGGLLKTTGPTSSDQALGP